MNETATLPPDKIVSLTPIASELICIFGCIDRIVGRDDHSLFPTDLSDKPAVGSSIRRTITAKRVLDLKPDVVVTGSQIPQEEFKKIEDSGVPVVVIGTSCELGSLINNIQTIGKLLAVEDKAKELEGFLNGYANLIRNRTAGLNINDRPRVYNECAFGKYTTKPCTTIADGCITLAGGANIARGEDPQRFVVNEDWVVKSNPDIIISQISSMSPTTKETLLAKRDEILKRPELKDTNAVVNERVYVSHLSVRRGPRMVGYLLYLAKWFHPELFEDIDPTAVEKEMLHKFYDIDLEGTWALP